MTETLHEHNHDGCELMTALVGVGSFIAGVAITRSFYKRKEELIYDDFRSIL